MRILNKILQLVVTLIFLIFVALGVLLIVAAVFGMQDLGVAKMLGVSVFVFVFGFMQCCSSLDCSARCWKLQRTPGFSEMLCNQELSK